MQKRQRRKHLPWPGELQTVFQPSAAFQDELPDVAPFNVLVSSLTNQILVLFFDRALIDDVVQRPRRFYLSSSQRLSCLVHTSHFLLHGSQEALRIEESSQPESIGPRSLQPLVQLFISLDQVVVPLGECGDDPRYLGSCGVVDPLVGHSCIEYSID